MSFERYVGYDDMKCHCLCLDCVVSTHPRAIASTYLSGNGHIVEHMAVYNIWRRGFNPSLSPVTMVFPRSTPWYGCFPLLTQHVPTQIVRDFQHRKIREGDNMIPGNASPCAPTIISETNVPRSVPTAIGSRRVNTTRFALDPGTTVRRNDRKLRRSDTCAYVVVSLYTGRPKDYARRRLPRTYCAWTYCTSPRQILRAPTRGANQCQCRAV
jgi:hypothetical protein